MAKKKVEDAPQEQHEEVVEEKKAKFNISKYIKIVVGVLVIIVGLLSYYWWWADLWTVFKGTIGLFVAMIGLLVAMIGFSD